MRELQQWVRCRNLLCVNGLDGNGEMRDEIATSWHFGSQIAKGGRVWKQCKEYGGSQICEHGRQH